MKIRSHVCDLAAAGIVVALAACHPAAGAGSAAGVSTTPSAGEPATPFAASASLPCNRVEVIGVYTNPRETILAPQTAFQVTFNLKNAGSCGWDSGYKLVFDHGERMDFSNPLPLSAATVAPGATRALTVPLIAPADEGTHEAFFKLRAADGTTFGAGPEADSAFGVTVTVLNRTALAQSYTPTSISTSTPTPVITPPVPTLDPNAALASFQFLEDVTVPDGSEVAPDTIFTKTWRVQNTGRMNVNDWSLLVFDHGDRMDAPAVQPLVEQDVNAEYGDVFDISVDLISPSSPGDYQAYFKIFVFHGPGNRNGSYAAITLSAKIRVTAPTPVPSGMAATQVVSSQVPVSSGYTSTVSVSCPPGTAVVGAGFSAFLNGRSDPLDALDSNSRIFSSHKQGNGWTVSGTNNWVSFDNPETPGGAITLQVIAVCLKDPAAVTTEVEMAVPVPEGRDAGVANVVCPEGSVVTGGGFSGRDFTFSESVLFGKGWNVSADKIVEGPAEFSAYAVCLSGVSAKTALISATTSFPNEYSGFAQAVCPVGSTPSGGGYLSNIYLDDASIHGQSWVVHAKNMSPTIQPARLKSYAVCLRLN
jgi:hypothetical protein